MRDDRQTTAGPSRNYPWRTVLLRHDTADGCKHFDWMIAQDADAAGPLVTFRLHREVTGVIPADGIPAYRIADHRPRYLDYEGEISGNRGTVLRLASGLVFEWTRQFDAGTERWRLVIQWTLREASDGDRVTELSLVHEKDAQWRVFGDIIETHPSHATTCSQPPTSRNKE